MTRSYLKEQLSEIVKYGLVGTTAATSHYLLVITLVSIITRHPLVANIIGYIFSSQISYWGHKNWTFHKNQCQFFESTFKYIATLIMALIINELLYAAILLGSGLDYKISLLISLIIMPGLFYLTSKFWIFA